jgi:tetratricopeptide (TPR) repeat protein
MLESVLKFSALELCELGDYQAAAAELAGLRVGEWPVRGSQGDCEHAEAILAAGIISSVAGGIKQQGDQVTARAMLQESLRLFGTHPKGHVAKAWLAWTDYWAGDRDGALSMAGTVLEAEINHVTRFRTLLLRAIIFWEQELPDRALAEIGQMEPLYDLCGPGLKGRFHIQRGLILRLQGGTDRAIVEYDSAITFFQEARDPRCLAVAANNLANIYLETGHFAQAHEYANQSQLLFRELGDKTYEAEAWDQTALIFLAEGELSKAEESINNGLALVKRGAVLEKCRTTRRKIKQEQGVRYENDATLCSKSPTPDNPLLANTSPGEIMSLREYASQLIQNEPDNSLLLYDFVVRIRSVRGDPRFEAELDEVEQMLHALTPDCEEHRAKFRQSRLIRPVTDS